MDSRWSPNHQGRRVDFEVVDFYSEKSVLDLYLEKSVLYLYSKQSVLDFYSEESVASVPSLALQEIC